MADGNWEQEQAPPLALRPIGPARLWAVCPCGGEAVLDPEPWLRQGLAGHPLHALQDRVRCACGRRSVQLEWRRGGAPRSPGPYAFR
jgi:hypothetical protein